MLGGSALEDKLQDQVPQILKELRGAEIAVWMITGDKLETAEHIGYSSNIFNKNTHLFRFADQDTTKIKKKIAYVIKTINEMAENNEEQFGYIREAGSQDLSRLDNTRV